MASELATEELPVPARRRRAVPLALGLGGVAVVGVVALTVAGGDGDDGGRRAVGGGSTATVTRQTLVQRETVDGTLGFAGIRTVINRLGGSGAAAPGGAREGTPDASSAASAPATSFAAFVPAQGDPEVAPEQGSDAPEQPEGKQPDDQEPETEQPEAGQPNGQPPQGAQPNAQEPLGSQPQSGEPQGRQPGAGTPAGSGDGDSGYSGSGTVTALPRPGSVVRRGGALYRLDGDPVVLMYGSTPAYRDLAAGVDDGRDVRQLEQNLAALGFDPGTIDESFTSSTAAAVAAWQEAAGLAETGSVELGRVVFLPGPRRIGGLKTSVGGVLAAGSEVLDTSSTKRLVNVELDASLQSLAREGDRVEVTLPDGSAVRGRISDVGRVAREKESSDAGSTPGAATEPELVIDVEVELRSARGIGRLDEAPVGVGLAQETRKNVLAVPVEALVARRGGGYGVELAGSHRIVPVRTGLFASGYVEISGGGVRDGTRVVVPDE